MTAPRISLPQQIEAVAFAIDRQDALARGQSVRGARPQSIEEYDAQRLRAALETLRWLEAHRDAVLAARRQIEQGCAS